METTWHTNVWVLYLIRRCACLSRIVLLRAQAKVVCQCAGQLRWDVEGGLLLLTCASYMP